MSNTIANPSKTAARRAWLLRRIVWAVLCGLHAAWLLKLSAAGDASSLRVVAMGLSVAFLLAKTLDASWLRFLTTRRAIVSGVLIIAILHVGVIDRALTDEHDLSFWVLPLLTSVPVMLVLSYVIRRRDAAELARVSAHLSIPPHAAHRVCWVSAAMGGPQFLPQPVRVLRGPPSNNL